MACIIRVVVRSASQRQRDAGEVLVLPGEVEPARQVERRTHLVGEQQRLAVERLDDRRTEIGGFGHLTDAG